MTNESEERRSSFRDGVEMFLTGDTPTNKPLILPHRSGSNLTAAQRRWRLLKNLKMAAKLPNSLTKSEELFLHSMQRKDKVADEEKKEEDEVLTKARHNLRASIASRSHAMTEMEVKFLQELAQAPHATAAYLQSSAEVLRKDPLFKRESLKIDEEAVARPLLTPSLKKRDASFRTEVWTKYNSTSSLFTNPPTPAAERKTLDFEEQARPKQNFFQRLFSNRDEPPLTEEDEEDMTPPDEPIEFSILATSAQDLDCQPHVLSPPIMDALRPFLPNVVQQDNFWIKYSLVRDGASMHCVLRNVRASARTVLAIETMDGQVFGCFTSSPWRPNGTSFFGSCEAFVWRMKESRFTSCHSVEDQIRLESTLEVFPWSTKNRNVQHLKSPNDYLIVGGGVSDDEADKSNVDEKEAGCAIMISSDLMNGSSSPCVTFESPALCQDFEISNLEVWALTPVEDVQQAEKLELGRQFVFDHGNFVRE